MKQYHLYENWVSNGNWAVNRAALPKKLLPKSVDILFRANVTGTYDRQGKLVTEDVPDLGRILEICICNGAIEHRDTGVIIDFKDNRCRVLVSSAGYTLVNIEYFDMFPAQRWFAKPNKTSPIYNETETVVIMPFSIGSESLEIDIMWLHTMANRWEKA